MVDTEALERGRQLPGVHEYMTAAYALGINPLRDLRKKFPGVWAWRADCLPWPTDSGLAAWIEDTDQLKGWLVTYCPDNSPDKDVSVC